MENNVEAKENKAKLLLHSCCGPCSTSVITRLVGDYDITVFYYNPNIFPQEEYLKRLGEQKRFLSLAYPEIKLIDGTYDDSNSFYEAFKGFEDCKEGGDRCRICMALRLKKTAQLAKEGGYDLFTTTLTVSPHKNAVLINELGESFSKTYNIGYMTSNFKKQDGYLNSIKLSKEYNLYRQNYCGCKFSMHD